MDGACCGSRCGSGKLHSTQVGLYIYIYISIYVLNTATCCVLRTARSGGTPRSPQGAACAPPITSLACVQMGSSSSGLSCHLLHLLPGRAALELQDPQLRKQAPGKTPLPPLFLISPSRDLQDKSVRFASRVLFCISGLHGNTPAILLLPAADANRASSQENVTSLKINSAARWRVLSLVSCWNVSAKTESHRIKIQLPTSNKEGFLWKVHRGCCCLLSFSAGRAGGGWLFFSLFCPCPDWCPQTQRPPLPPPAPLGAAAAPRGPTMALLCSFCLPP